MLVETEQEGLDRGPSGVAVSPDGAHVYVAQARGDLVVFRRDAATGALSFVEAQADGLHDTRGKEVIVSPDGANVYAAGAAGQFADTPLAVFQRDAATGALDFLETAGAGPVDFFGFGLLAVSPDGANVYLGPQVFRRDLVTGALSSLQAPGRLGAGGISVALSPDGADVYMTTQLDFLDGGAVLVYRRELTTGSLSFLEVQGQEAIYQTLGGNSQRVHARTPLPVTVSPDGANVYVAWESAGGPVITFRRDPSTGRLTLLVAGSHLEVGTTLYRLLVSPDGAFVYGVSLNQGLAVFRRRARTGSLRFLGLEKAVVTEHGGPFDTGVAVSPDGAFVYVSQVQPDGVEVYRVASSGT